ncbi:hypothetical protein L873DRAFT_1677582, partial [Choiromyces venosus 120613-1]
EFVMVIEGICVDGSSLKLTIILKMEEFIGEWFHRIRGVPEDILFGCLHNRGTDEKMAQTYLKQNFGEGSTIAYKVQGAYQLLLFDGHSSHINAAFLEFYVSHNIIPYCLPPYTINRLQTLNVSVFGPYKH